MSHPLTYIKIHGVSQKHKDELEQIARQQGFSTMTAFWKHHIKNIVSQPQKIILADPPTGEQGEIRIQKIKQKDITLLTYIAANMGFTTLTAFMKVKIKEIINTTSDRNKQNPDDET